MSCTVFMGLRGGVGTTRAAISATRASSSNAALLDLDVMHPAAARMLGISSGGRTLADVLQQSEGMWGSSRDAWMVTPDGSIVVSPSSQLEEADHIDDEFAIEIIDELVGAGYAVVVDAGSHCGVAVIGALTRATCVVLVVGHDNRGSDRIDSVRTFIASINSGVHVEVFGGAAQRQSRASWIEHIVERIRHLAKPAMGS